MPSGEHESPLQLTRLDPELIAWLLGDHFGVDLPVYARVQPHATEVREMVPRTYHADGVVVFNDEAGQAVLGAVVEMQRSRDVDKVRTWKQYACTLEADLRAPTLVVVFCRDALAGWYQQRLEKQSGSVRLFPYLVTPGRVPLVTDPAQAGARPAAAILSTLLHAREPDIDQAFPALVNALNSLNDATDLLYYDLVLAGLPPEAKMRWEAYMDTIPAGYTFKSDTLRKAAAEGKAKGLAEGKAKGLAEGKAEGLAKGKAEGEARAVLAVLDARGLSVPPKTRERILRTTDFDRLETWLRRAATATSTQEALGDA